MNPRKFLNFVRSKTGLLILFLAALSAVLFMVNSRQEKVPKPKATTSQNPPAGPAGKPQVVERILRNMVPFRPPPADAQALTTPVAPVKATTSSAAMLPPISIVTETPSTEPKPKEFSADFAPFGRLIPCELIVTVDSSSINTPVIGLVTEDVYHHGHVIIPAGTEVHGTAQIDRVRERIASDGRWTLVWQSGEELRVSGLALDREEEVENGGWGITDGSAGLRGRLIKQDDLAEIKLFAATLLSGAAEALTAKQATPFGSVAIPSLTNAPLQGAQSVLDRYANEIQRGIERDGFYVRVPAGKQFYLYVTQTLDRADAKVGGEPVTIIPPPSASDGKETAEPRALFRKPSAALRPMTSDLNQPTP